MTRTSDRFPMPTDTRGAPSDRDLLLRLLDDMQQLRAEVRVALEKRQRTTRLTRVDRDRLATILPVLIATLGSELFMVREAS